MIRICLRCGSEIRLGIKLWVCSECGFMWTEEDGEFTLGWSYSASDIWRHVPYGYLLVVGEEE